MALREFTDSHGIDWRVWDVTPAAISPRTAAEDFMADLQDGWLCFESAGRRCRLVLYPSDWASASDAQLEELLHRAEESPKRAPGEPVRTPTDTPVYRAP